MNHDSKNWFYDFSYESRRNSIMLLMRTYRGSIAMTPKQKSQCRIRIALFSTSKKMRISQSNIKTILTMFLYCEGIVHQ